MGDIIGIAMIGALALLGILEFVRYRRAFHSTEGIPYPRRRLARRLAVMALFIFIMIIAIFWPDQAAIGLRLTLIILMLVAMAIGLVLLLRDLHETSVSIVQYSNRLNEHAARELEEIIKEKAGIAEGNSSESSDNTPPAG